MMILRIPADPILVARVKRRGAAAALALLAAICWSGRAAAADMPETILRGPVYTEERLNYVPWEGIVMGGQIGYTNLSADFSGADSTTTLGQPTTNSITYGGFLGYNVQWEHLVVGFDFAYNRPASLETSSTVGTSTASLKLVDYATARARAGYAFGQFLPYGFLGVATGRFNYSVVSATATTSRDNAYAAGFVAGLGLDVAITPNIFVRAEYEYIAFSQLAYEANTVFGGLRSSTNTGRVAVGVRF